MEENRQNITITAEEDAVSDASKLIWFIAGLGLSILGVLLAYIYQQEPPGSRFLDKSQEYIVIYKDSYKAKLRSIQVMYSLVGLVIIVGLIVLYAIFLLSTIFRFQRHI
ncbi:hypothetical protein C6497_03840 [Candidatus Poribacteria bacterium]|nr:MAG: hypothetical protein C6497_03840 [Candidatus Poribacteria bacterium]